MKNYLIALAICLFFNLNLYSQGYEEITGVKKIEIVDSLSKASIDWTEVGLSGKIRADKLPVKPTVKVYMKRGEETIISLRAPFLGELGRAEIFGDDVTLINKHNKTFVKGSLSSLSEGYPNLTEDLQEFLLGEAVIFGVGTVNRSTEKDISFFDTGDGVLLMRPKRGLSAFDYGYVIGDDYLPAMLIATIGSSDNLEIGYSFADSGKYLMEFLYKGKKKTISADLEFEDPDFTPRKIERLELDKKYREVTVKEFLSKF